MIAGRRLLHWTKRCPRCRDGDKYPGEHLCVQCLVIVAEQEKARFLRLAAEQDARLRRAREAVGT